jgi:hypothetical protein
VTSWTAACGLRRLFLWVGSAHKGARQGTQMVPAKANPSKGTPGTVRYSLKEDGLF